MVLDRLVYECDVVVHLAAAVGVKLIVDDPMHTIRTNVLGTDCVLKTACRYKRKVLIASTSEIYGKSTKIPFSEDDDTTSGPTTKSRWSYACSKAMDEFSAFACAKSFDLPVVITRFFNTVGPRQSDQYGMVIPTLMKQALAGQDITVYGDGEQSRCFNHVEVVVQAVYDLLNTPGAIGQVYNVGSDQLITINELAQKIKTITGSSSKIVHIPYGEVYGEGFEDMQIRQPDLKKIRSVISYDQLPTIDDIINSVMKHMKNS
jgi:UDP-glucose 4-epimerase